MSANPSKFLSLILRHQPELIGLELDENGWASTEELLQKARTKGVDLSLDQLIQIVTTNDKQRFALSPDHSRIRANQGHSIDIELRLEAQTPPAIPYHGTAERNLASILRQGLLKGSRHHVHLSVNPDTARAVGARFGKPMILTIDAAQMAVDGYVFYQSENGVWLTDAVPARYISSL